MSTAGRTMTIAVMAAAAAIWTGCANKAADGTATTSTSTASPTHASSSGSGSGSGKASRPATSVHGQAVQFAECMRGHGISGFPDPDASGSLTIDAVANGTVVDTHSAAWTSALAACQSLEPAGFTGTGRTPAQQQAALQFAQCVRDHGVTDFPDPTTTSPLIDTDTIPSTKNGLGPLNAATQACRSYAAAAGVTPR